MAKEAEEKGALMTESLMVQRLKSFQEKNEEKLEKYRRNVEASKKYVQAEDLSINEIGLIHDYYINVIAKIHPDVHYYTPPLNISIFKRAQMAFITNDIAALKNIHDTTTDNREDLSVREKQVLLDKMEYLIQKKTIKLEWIPLRAPYDKKNIINDPHEMEKEKAKINHEIQQFEMIQKQLETISERIVFMADA